jgi:hypothetical protein
MKTREIIITCLAVFGLLVVFQGTRYIESKKIDRLGKEKIELEKTIEILKFENGKIEKSYRILEVKSDSLEGEIARSETLYRRGFEEGKKSVQSVDTMDIGEQQDFFDNRYSPTVSSGDVLLDSIQANRAIKDIKERDVYLVSLLELERINVTYKAYAFNAAKMIENRDEMIINLNDEIRAKDRIISLSAEENEVLVKQIKKEKIKTKLVGVAGIILTGAAIYISN